MTHQRKRRGLIGWLWDIGWAFQRWWFRLWLRNFDLYLILICWAVTLLFVAGVEPNASIAATALEWVVGSIFVSIAPVLSVLYVLRKRSGLSLIKGWTHACRNGLRPSTYAAAAASVLLLVILATRFFGVAQAV